MEDEIKVVSNIDDGVAPVNKPPRLSVAVTVITRQGRILAVHNPKWNSFTMPMTKLRNEEEWLDAAIRAAAETLDCVFRISPDPEKPFRAHCTLADIDGRGVGPLDRVLIMADYIQSLRDSKNKVYNINVFWIDLDMEPQLAPGVRARWLTPQQFCDDAVRPISHTARDVVKFLCARAEQDGKHFPDRTIKWL